MGVTGEIPDYDELNRAGRRAAEKGARQAGYEVDVPFALDFEGTSYEGFEMTVRSLDVRGMFMLARLDIVSKSGQLKLDPRDVDDVEMMFGLLADHIVEWNAQRNGQLLTDINTDTVMSLGINLVMHILQMWFKGMTQVSGPLAQPSNDGSPLLEQSLTMAPLSPNPPS